MSNGETGNRFKNCLEVKSITEFVERVFNLPPPKHGGGYIFRGQGKDWLLLPKIARKDLVDAHTRNKYLEKNLLERFRLNAVAYLPVLERTETRDWWRCAAYAQHHKLPTRLLDWTRSPLTALFFAVEKPDSSSQYCWVYAYPTPEVFTYSNQQFNEKPWEYKTGTVSFLQPDITHPRIMAQSGLFAVHPGSPSMGYTQDVYSDELFGIKIPTCWANDLLKRLAVLGINRATLFPEPDKIVEHLVWEVINKVDRLADDV